MTFGIKKTENTTSEALRILTFDIEDWFHVLDHATTKTEADWSNYESRIKHNVARILNFLDKHHQKATFFCLGWVGRKHPDIIRDIIGRGHEIGSHSNVHQLVYEQTPDEFACDLTTSLSILEDVTGSKIKYYRAPGFSITEKNIWALETLVQNGIEVDCSLFPARRAHGGFTNYTISGPSVLNTPSGSLQLFPINIREIFGKSFIYSGGGYFRLFPNWLLMHWLDKDDYVMTYFHPRDFDPDQPMLPDLSALRKFKGYVGLSRALGKLEKQVEKFSFCDLTEAKARVDWTQVPQLNIEMLK